MRARNRVAVTVGSNEQEPEFETDPFLRSFAGWLRGDVGAEELFVDEIGPSSFLGVSTQLGLLTRTLRRFQTTPSCNRPGTFPKVVPIGNNLPRKPLLIP
jgi:hypothetical protein